MDQHIKLYWSLVFQTDESSGDITAFYLQCPEASAQGRTKEEAKALLHEIFPYALKEKKEEFLCYHDNVVIEDQLVFA